MATAETKDRLAKYTAYTAASRLTSAAHSAFLATLGAGAKIQEDCSALFSDLVEKGEKVEAQAKTTASNQVDKLEQAIESYMSSIWKRLGGASRNDFTNLSQRVDELNKSVKELKTLNLPQQSGGRSISKVG